MLSSLDGQLAYRIHIYGFVRMGSTLVSRSLWRPEILVGIRSVHRPDVGTNNSLYFCEAWMVALATAISAFTKATVEGL
jgi:hypothetical protein